ncbi:anthocyanidin 3-O-glucosyltransferase 7-like [Vigna unguiculata]|uniref:anthocyanidin 3-O-glucosyltransferase 7-like n=1 Tax=Vigna unguiculata TaxID=3917 RepID=UPI001016C6BC|nr:anthocyanidin 3-O-glucosyltransferase 7-like [Vigna unguiculata]
MANSEEKKHVAVFSFPFGSHPTPLLNLVLKLANAAPNLQFSFIGTEHSNNPLLISNPHIPNTIKFYSISDGVPEGHVPGGHPVERVNLFLQACPHNLQKGIDMAVAHTKQRVTSVIADAFVAPSLTVAQRLNVPWVAVWPPLSCSLSAHFYTDLIRHRCNSAARDTPLDFVPGLSKMRVEDLPEDVIQGVGEEETLFSKTLASLGSVLPQAEAVVVNFFEELDPPLLAKDMKSKFKYFLYVGFLTLSLPLPPLPPSDTDGTGCLSWLDKQKGGSVAYVSFGTVVTPPPHEIVAVAEALEASGFPFLWSLKEHLKGVLPSGFLERTRERGKVVAWAPQTQVLGHGSVGVFVTHCGCNSVFESMSNGVPMICRPFFGDHGLTGRMVEDVWEIGVRVEGGVFTKDGLVKCLRLILVEEEGNLMKKNAVKVKTTVVDAAGAQGKAAQDLNTLVEVVSRS